MIPENWTWCGNEDTCRNCDATAVFLSPDKSEWYCCMCGTRGENGRQSWWQKLLKQARRNFEASRRKGA